MINIDEIISKYEGSVIKNINMSNFRKIINFLKEQNCDFIDDILEDYLDLFTFEFDDFVKRYNKINGMYGNHYLEQAKSNMNLLEELYND